MLDKVAVSRLFVAPTATIREAVKRLDAGGKGIVLVVDSNHRLLGTITDGDVRRAMLDNVSFEEPITSLLSRKVARYRKPFSVSEQTSREDMIRLMREHVIRQLPITDDHGNVVGLITMDDLLPTDVPIEAVLYPNGEHWKHGLLPLGNRPLLAKVIDSLHAAGITNVRIASDIATNEDLSLTLSRELRLDTTNASHEHSSTNGVANAYDDHLQVIIGAPILTQISFRSLLQYHREHHADMTIAVRRLNSSQEEQYVEVDGLCIRDVPKQPRERFLDAGIYVLGPKARQVASEYSLDNPRDIARALIAADNTVVSFPIHEYWAQITSLEDYHQVLADNRRGLLDTSFQYEPGTPSPAGTVPLCVPEIRGNEWSYIRECLDTNWVSSVGPYVDTFEAAFAHYVGARCAVAVCNGTSALHVALLLAGVRPGDEVFVSSLSFVAPANAIRYVGAIPRFIDAEPLYWQIDSNAIARYLHEYGERRRGTVYNRLTGRRIAALLPVHILGHPCDMDPLIAIAREYNLPIVEDASESLGGFYRGRHVGTMGLLGCFSFNGNKLITTGGGGMIVTNDEALAHKAKYLTTQAKDDPIEFIHGEIGYNYRLTNIQAAMGCAQLEHVDSFLERKRSIADRYAAELKDIAGLELMQEAEWARHSWWLYTIRVKSDAFGMDRRSLMRHLAARGIQTRPLWQPLHQSPAHRQHHDQGPLPHTESIQAEALSLPCSAGISDSDLDRVIRAIQDLSRQSVSS